MNSSKLLIIAAATAAIFGAATSAYAQGSTSSGTTGMANRTDGTAAQGMNYSDRSRMQSWNSDQEKLTQLLKVGAKKDDYRKILADNGYTITAITKDATDSLEYEVVKGDQSYEVQIDLDKATGMGNKVDVGSNLWRADATKEALRTGKAVLATKTLANGDVYSDRTNRKGWTDQKDMLQKRLVPGKNVAFYTAELKKMGYQITATNDTEKDYVELEVVKGRDSYEVQMDRNDAGIVDKIDVTTNMWQSDATDRAMGQSNQPLNQGSTNRTTTARSMDQDDRSGTTTTARTATTARSSGTARTTDTVDTGDRTDASAANGRSVTTERVARADRN